MEFPTNYNTMSEKDISFPLTFFSASYAVLDSVTGFDIIHINIIYVYNFKGETIKGSFLLLFDW